MYDISSYIFDLPIKRDEISYKIVLNKLFMKIYQIIYNQPHYCALRCVWKERVLAVVAANVLVIPSTQSMPASCNDDKNNILDPCKFFKTLLRQNQLFLTNALGLNFVVSLEYLVKAGLP